VTVEQKEVGNIHSAGGTRGSVPLPLPEHDVRRKRPPLLSFVLRLETLRRVSRVISLLVLDFVGVVGALYTAVALKLALHDQLNWSVAWQDTKHWIPFAYLVTVLLFARVDLYADRNRRPGLSAIATALFQATVIALVFALADGQHFSSYFIFYGSLIFATIYISALRELHLRLTGKVLEQAGYRRRAVLVGSGKHIEEVARALADRAKAQVEILGYVSLTPRPQNGLRSLGRLDEMAEVLEGERPQEVIIADPDFPQDDAVELVDQCHRRGVRVRLAPSTMEILIHRAEFVPGQSVPLFELGPPVFEGIDFALKRTFDIVGATVLLVLLSPLLLAITLAVRVSSRGPILFHSMRRGIGQRPFACLKFRTMHTDAEESQAELEELNEASGALFKIREDPRLTPIGHLLRRFSLDELPQLINVLRGEMSLVGPRPLPERDYAMLEDWHRKRYLVLPGLTGLWQVSGRSELDFDDLVHLDFIYLENWSLALDLTILLKTIPAVLTRRGAY
jgi:exopolysaccharide biosynthesis polyprenyl glycosylphosphotransferase